MDLPSKHPMKGSRPDSLPGSSPRVACLAWGSLVWRPGGLPVGEGWLPDGPPSRVEFVREAADGRLTLVLYEGGTPVDLLWAEMDADLEEARERLRVRERISAGSPEEVGIWNAGEPAPTLIPDLPGWAERRELDHVIWTGLRPRFRGRDGSAPTLREAVDYLDGLSGECLSLAREYVCRTPQQVVTHFRTDFQTRFGWSHDPKGALLREPIGVVGGG